MTPRLAFVCVRNAGRSQMAAAFAERERDRRGLGDEVEIVSGGTDPADSVHDVVVDVMGEAGIDVSDRRPRRVDESALADCDVVAAMGCSTLDLPDGVDARDWGLADPHGAGVDDARGIRDEIEARVVELFDEIAEASDGRSSGTSDGRPSETSDGRPSETGDGRASGVTDRE